MKYYKILNLMMLSTVFLIIGCTTGARDISRGKKSADTVFINGQFYTVDEKQKWAESVAVEDGTILFVGFMKGIDPYIGQNTQVIDLEGKFAMPAFVESHIHTAWPAYTRLFAADLDGLDTTEQYIDKIRKFADANPDLAGIMGAGFNRALYDSTGPKKEWLDKIDTTRPIAVTDMSLHSMWVNSKVLEMLDITNDTPDPEGGVIKRDPKTGEPSGLLQGNGAMDPVWDLLPYPTKAQYKKSLLWLQDWLNSKGITTAHDAWAEFDPAYYNAYNELAQEGKLTVRYRGSWYIDHNEDWDGRDYRAQIKNGIKLAKRFNYPHFKLQSFKFLADQVLEEEAALLIESYEHIPDYYGGAKDWPEQDCLDAFTRVDKAGYQIHVHVIGDRATKDTLNIFEKVQKINGKRDSRHSLAHIQMARQEDIKKMGLLGITAHMSQYWMGIDDYFWKFYLPYLGKERAYNTYPHKSLFDAGVNVTVASDWTTSEPDLMAAIYTGMKRRMPFRVYKEFYGDNDTFRYIADPDAELKDNDIGCLPPASECVSLEQMLEAATINGAYANFLEDEIGSIEVGKKADIVVLNKNLFSINSEDIPNVKIEMTFFEGKRVY